MDMVMLALCALIALPWLYLVPWVEGSTLVLAVTAALALLVVVSLAWFGERLLEHLYPLLQKLPTGDWLSRLGRSGVNGLQTSATAGPVSMRGCGRCWLTCWL